MKKTIKIIIIFLLVAVMSFTLASCALFEGESAYDIAVRNGFVGTEQEWLNSLKGKDGWAGEIVTAYEVAVLQGYEGTVEQWLASLKGEDGSIDITVSGSDDQAQQVVVANSLLSAVSIVATHNVGRTDWGHPSLSTTSFSGAGVIYKLNKEAGTAYIITNYHVMYYSGSADSNKIASNIKVWLYGMETNSQSITATYIGGSMTYDIAVLKIVDSDIIRTSNCRSVIVDYDVNAGEKVYAVGNPAGEGMAVTSGIVSVDREVIKMKAADEVTNADFSVIRTDAPINGGNSGGGLFDSSGKLLGIVNAKTIDEEIEGMGYALPAVVAVAVADNCIYYCDNNSNIFGQKFTLGVAVAAQSSKSVYDNNSGLISIVETVVVQEVSYNSLSFGKLQVGDILLSASVGQTAMNITRYYQLGELLLTIRKEDQLTLKVMRNSQEVIVTFEFVDAPLTQIA